MKDKLSPCIYYTNAHGICGKGRKDVTLKKCRNCPKYKGRKLSKKPEPVRLKREKAKRRSERGMGDD